MAEDREIVRQRHSGHLVFALKCINVYARKMHGLCDLLLRRRGKGSHAETTDRSGVTEPVECGKGQSAGEKEKARLAERNNGMPDVRPHEGMKRDVPAVAANVIAAINDLWWTDRRCSHGRDWARFTRGVAR